MPAPQTRLPGVLGGLGPAATVDFLARLLRVADAVTDQEHIRVLVDHNPQVPNRNLALEDGGESPGPVLAAMGAGLEASGATFLVMPCNTAMAWASDIRAKTSVPLISIVDEASRAAQRTKATRAGVLSTRACAKAQLYEDGLRAVGLEPLSLDGDEWETFMTALYRIKAGDLEHGRAAMRSLSEGLLGRGAEVIIAGCTEVPLVLGANDVPVPFIDSTEELARRTVAYARGEALP